MKLTFTVSSKNKYFEHSISARRLLSIAVLSSMFMLISSRSTDSVTENLARINVSKQIVASVQQELNVLSERSSTQLSAINEDLALANVQLAELHSRLGIVAKTLGMRDNDLMSIESKINEPATELSPLQGEILKLQQNLASKQSQLSMLESLVRGHHIDKQVQLSGRPIQRGWLSSYYGTREDPFTGEPAEHNGLDFAGNIGDDVIATGAGIVSWAGKRYGYGEMVEIDHINGIKTRYAHNDAVHVAVGDVVTKGQVIALMGSSGRSTGAHVHYEVLKNGNHVNPLPFVDSHNK